MTRKRFSAIRNNLHMVDINARKRDRAKRLYKVRQIAELIRNRLKNLTLEKNLWVDNNKLSYLKANLQLNSKLKENHTHEVLKFFSMWNAVRYPDISWIRDTLRWTMDQNQLF